MKEVYDISLQGFSFKVEKDAFELLESYLEELKQHYGVQEAEVVNDIEERISELLIEKGCINGTVVRFHHIDEIIETLGRPSEIEDSPQRPVAAGVKKGIYRDTRNGIVAGVCSGLGAYFNMDAVWVRIIFILLAILVTAPSFFVRNFFGIHMGWFGFLLLVYAILWVIIPEAKTISQRCAMRGEPQSVDHIHSKFAQGARNVGNEMWDMGTKATGTVFSTLWRIFCFTVGVILTATGFGGIVALGIGFVGADILIGIPLLSIPDFIALNIGSTLWLKIFGVLAALLPFVGMLYGGMQLCFRFKSPKWRPGLIIFMVWIISALVFILGSLKAFAPYYDLETDYKEQIDVSSQKDTLYITCPEIAAMDNPNMNMEAARNSLQLFYRCGNGRNSTFVTYPRFKVKRGNVEKPYIQVSMTVPSDAGNAVTLKDSLITLNPATVSRKEKFAGEVLDVKLFVPDSTTVILKEPVEFVFGKQRSIRTGMYK